MYDPVRVGEEALVNLFLFYFILSLSIPFAGDLAKQI